MQLQRRRPQGHRHCRSRLRQRPTITIASGARLQRVSTVASLQRTTTTSKCGHLSSDLLTTVRRLRAARPLLTVSCDRSTTREAKFR